MGINNDNPVPSASKPNAHTPVSKEAGVVVSGAEAIPMTTFEAECKKFEEMGFDVSRDMTTAQNEFNVKCVLFTLGLINACRPTFDMPKIGTGGKETP